MVCNSISGVYVRKKEVSCPTKFIGLNNDIPTNSEKTKYFTVLDDYYYGPGIWLVGDSKDFLIKSQITLNRSLKLIQTTKPPINYISC